MGCYLWYGDDGTVQNIGPDWRLMMVAVHLQRIVIFHARFKFSWKICNALLMMMMQRLNHRFVM